VEEILRDIDACKAVDYASKASVRRYNAAMDRIRKRFFEIDGHAPEQVGKLMSLLTHADADVVMCCVILLELNSCTLAQKKQVLQTLQALAAREDLDDLHRVGLEFVLPEWEEKLATAES